MIRRLLLCSAATLAVFAATASAAPPQISDPKGDWHIPSQDIVSGGGLSLDASGRLVATMKLAAPLAEVPGTYRMVFYRGECDSYLATLDWRGPSLPSTSTLEVSTWCSRELVPNVSDPRPNSAKTYPAPATISGSTVSWTLPALPDFAPGQLLRGPAAIAAPNPGVLVGVGFWGTSGPSGEAYAYDLAYSRPYEYVVGTR